MYWIFDTLSYNEKNKDSIFLNILLGIYAKIGINHGYFKGKAKFRLFIRVIFVLEKLKLIKQEIFKL